MEIVLTINKETVYEEVAKTTEYTGAKMDDEHAYETISTTEEDKSILERFWNECKNMVCNSLKKVLISEEETNGEYSLTLGLSTAFDDSLTASMQRSLFSFFVMNITANGTHLPTRVKQPDMLRKPPPIWKTSCAKRFSRKSQCALHTIRVTIK